jgi:MFS family permease
MISEIIPKSYRGKALVLTNFFISIGKMWGCLIAYICMDSLKEGNWRLMMLLSAIPNILVYFGMAFWVLESPRFLIASGKIDEGICVLNQIIKQNKRNI